MWKQKMFFNKWKKYYWQKWVTFFYFILCHIKIKLIVGPTKLKEGIVLWSISYKSCGYQFLCINQLWWHKLHDINNFYKKLSGCLATRYPHKPIILRIGYKKTGHWPTRLYITTQTWLLWILVHWISFINLILAIQLLLILVAFTLFLWWTRRDTSSSHTPCFLLPGRSE